MPNSKSSSTPTFSAPLPSNVSSLLYCGSMGAINLNMSTMAAVNYWACGTGYESALLTSTKKAPETTFSANMPTSSNSILDCGYSSVINLTENNRSAVDYWNCGRTYARDYALSDALSLKPTNVLQYFIFALFIACIIL
ncbi:SMKI16G0688 [Saccharomyces mikatae IFO 1815]|uniref:SMKI16G0688 protein n=1 Tax=Saccharomyces mikatae IFO 1815 TaxID=226126 RepID=A0AA35NFC6_SACMI|nr:uncharacterized protein SMKI_16G0688 [Saccharomyces mikatae IFO 1815]CAI4036767.1 SMKI16G0688 [Saccharomyces mikatae IFO 1815]